MSPILWAILLRPIVLPILFVAIVAPIAWLLYRLFPEGRVKVMLFKVRTGPDASPRDKWVMAVAGVAAYAVLIGIGMLSAGMRWPP